MSVASRIKIKGSDAIMLHICGAIFLVLISFVLATSALHHQSAHADNVPVSLHINPALEISTSANSVSLNPEVGNNTPDTGDVDVIVSTNAPNGYTLLAHMTGGESGSSLSGEYDQGCLKNIPYSAMDCASIPAQNKINPNTSTSLAFNTWGISLDGGSSYLPFTWHEQTYDDLLIATYTYCDLMSVMSGNTQSISSCLLEYYDMFRNHWDELGPGVDGYVGGETDDQKAALLITFFNNHLQFMQVECADPETFNYCEEVLSMSPYTKQYIINKYALNNSSYWRIAPLRTTSANSVNSTTTVTFGTKVDFSVIAGAYANVITFTAIANPSPEPLITGLNYQDYESSFGFHTVYIQGVQLDALQSIEVYNEPGTIACELGVNLVINSSTSATCTDPARANYYYRPLSGQCGGGIAGYWSIYGTYIPRTASDALC